MKTFLAALGLLFLTASLNAETAETKATLALVQVSSSTLDQTRTQLMTDVLRTALFKTGLFQLKEGDLVQRALGTWKVRGNIDDADLIAVGRSIPVDKMVITRAEKLGDSTNLNLRIIDVGTSRLDFADNTTVKTEDQIPEAFRRIVAKIQLRFGSSGVPTLTIPSGEAAAQRSAAWTLFGAEGTELMLLVDQKADPEAYLNLRQFNGDFTPGDFIQALAAHDDLDTVKMFFQAGLTWPTTHRAMALKITSLDDFYDNFQPEGFSIDQYLTSVEQGLRTADELKSYITNLNQDFLLFGAGVVASSFPIPAAHFKYLFGQVGWEHFWTKSLAMPIRLSSEAGFFLLNFMAPAPYIGMDVTMGQAPVYAKVGVGEYGDFLIGGSYGTAVRLGLEVLNDYELTFIVVPVGSQPYVSYADLTSVRGSSGYASLEYPYYGLLFTYKLTVGK